MLSKIEISNFKKITEKLVLDGLAPVNYLVGPNGGGKSSVLEGVYFCIYLNNLDSLIPLLEEREFNFQYFSDCIAKNRNENKTLLNNKYKITLEYENSEIRELFSFSVPDKKSFDCAILYCNSKTNIYQDNVFFTNKDVEKEEKKKIYMQELKILMKKYKIFSLSTNLEMVYHSKLGENNKPENRYYEKLGEKYPLIKQKFSNIFNEMNLLTTSQGKNTFSYLLHNILHINAYHEYNVKYFLIEEPENYLHPTFQKLLPKLFQELSKELDIQFLISTHSPFIVSAAAKEDGQKVYLIDSGKTVGLDFNLENRDKYKNYNSPDSQKGFYGGECILVTIKMLGAGINDYFPSTVFFCEESMRVLISTFVNRDDIKDKVKNKPLLIPAGGDSDILQKSVILNSILQSFEAYQTNKFTMVHTDVKAIIDKNSEVENKKCEILKKYPNSVIVIEANEQEEKYPERLKNDNSRIEKDCTDNKFLDFYTKYLNNPSLNKKELSGEIGKLKSDFAKYVGENMTKEEFQEFCSELHNCIFGKN